MGFIVHTPGVRRADLPDSILTRGMRTNAYQFGGRTIEARGQLAGTVGQFGQKAAAMVDGWQYKVQLTTMQEALNEARDQFNAYDQQYRKNNEGGNARNAQKDYEEFLNELRRKYLGKIKHHRLREEYAMRLESIVDAGMDVGRRWQEAQVKQWQEGTVDENRKRALGLFTDPEVPQATAMDHWVNNYLEMRDRLYPGDLESRKQEDYHAFLGVSEEKVLQGYRVDVEVNPRRVERMVYGVPHTAALSPDQAALARREAEAAGVDADMAVSFLAARAPGGADKEAVREELSAYKTNLEKYRDPETALAALHLGGEAMDEWLASGKAGSLPPETVRFVNMVMGKDLDMAHQAVGEDKRLALASELDARWLEQASVTQKASDARRGEAERELYEMGYGGSLTVAEVEKRRADLGTLGYRRFRNIAEGRAALPGSSSSSTLAALTDMAAEGEADFPQEAEAAFARGELTLDDYRALLEEAPRWNDPALRDAYRAIRDGLERDGGDEAADAGRLARQEFMAWYASPAGQTAKRGEMMAVAGNISRTYKLASLEREMAGVPAPSFLVGSRNAPDIAATLEKTNRAWAAGAINAEQYGEECARLRNMDEIIRRRNAEKE